MTARAKEFAHACQVVRVTVRHLTLPAGAIACALAGFSSSVIRAGVLPLFGQRRGMAVPMLHPRSSLLAHGGRVQFGPHAAQVMA